MKNFIVTRNDNSGMSFALYILSGARKDKVAGTAHFFEHMVTTSYEDDEKDLERELLDLGVSHNACTSYNAIKIGYPSESLSLYDENVWKKSVEYFGLKFKRALDGSLFKEENIDKERSIILNEESLYSKDRRLYTKIFNDLSTNYENECMVVGNPDSIKRIGKTPLWNFTKHNLKQDNIFITISLPKYLSDEEVEHLVDYLFKNWINIIPKGKYESFLDDPKFEIGSKLRKDLPEYMTYNGCTNDVLYCVLDSKNLTYPEHKLIAEALDQWTFDAIRTEKALCYLTTCDPVMDLADHKFCLISTSEKEHFDEIIDIWKKKLNNFSISNKEKTASITKIRASYELEAKNANICLIEDIVEFGDIDYLRKILSILEQDPDFSPYDYYKDELQNILLTDKSRTKKGLQKFKDLGRHMLDNIKIRYLYKEEEKNVK